MKESETLNVTLELYPLGQTGFTVPTLFFRKIPLKIPFNPKQLYIQMTEQMNQDPPRKFHHKSVAFYPDQIRYTASLEGGPSIFTTPLPYQRHIQSFPTPQQMFGEYTAIITVHYLFVREPR